MNWFNSFNVIKILLNYKFDFILQFKRSPLSVNLYNLYSNILNMSYSSYQALYLNLILNQSNISDYHIKYLI